MRLGSIEFGSYVNGFNIDVIHTTEKPDGFTCNHKEYVSFIIKHDFASLEYRLAELEIIQLIKMLEKRIE
jgi:hypothetical protein